MPAHHFGGIDTAGIAALLIPWSVCGVHSDAMVEDDGGGIGNAEPAGGGGIDTAFDADAVSILEDDDEDDPFEQWREYDLVLGEGLALDEDGQVVEVY